MTLSLANGLAALAISGLAWAGPGLAQQDRSAEFARQSVAATMAGDRQVAIVAALRGLPPEPTDADFDAFAPAHDALFRAAAARIIHVERSGFQHYAVNSGGDRAVIGPANGPEDGSGEAPPYLLVGPRDGSRIAELVTWDVPMSLVYGPATVPAFSPDGSLVALWAMDAGQALLFDTGDGRPHPPLEGSGTPGGIVGDRLLVWDIASGDRVSGSWPDRIEGAAPVGWTPDGSFIVARPEFENYEIAAVSLDRYGEGGLDGTSGSRPRAQGWTSWFRPRVTTCWCLSATTSFLRTRCPAQSCASVARVTRSGGSRAMARRPAP